MDTYIWKVTYTDGTTLQQIDPDGSKHAYADIDRRNIASFAILKDGNIILSVPFTSGQNLIWRRRVEMNPAQGVVETCHIIGKQETVNGQNHQIVFAVFESDGRVEVSDKFDDRHPWFFPVIMNPHE